MTATANTFATVGGNQGTGTAWANPGNISSNDAVYASATLAKNSTSQYLYGSAFGFALPAFADIQGIVVTVKGYVSNTSNAYPSSIYLYNGSAAVGTKTLGTGTWTTTNATYTYGSSTDNWGGSLTAAQINSTGFGAAIQATSSAFKAGNVYVDSISITVYYTPHDTTPHFTYTVAETSTVSFAAPPRPTSTTNAFGGTGASYPHGTIDWVSPGNAAGSTDTTYTSITLAPTDVGYDLAVSNFGFSVPTDAVIIGISAEINCYYTTFYPHAYVSFEGDVAAASYLNSQVLNVPDSAQSVSVTGNTASFTPAQINSSSFGIVLQISGQSFTLTTYVDSIRINVTYKTGFQTVNYTATAATITGINGPHPWINPSYSTGSPDSVYTTNTMTNNVYTDWLGASGFNNSIPSDAIIESVAARVYGLYYSGTTPFAPSQRTVSIETNLPTVSGTNNFTGTLLSITTVPTTFLFDQWQSLPTVAQINSSNFGVAIGQMYGPSTGSTVYYIDSIDLIVKYSLPLSSFVRQRPIITSVTETETITISRIMAGIADLSFAINEVISISPVLKVNRPLSFPVIETSSIVESLVRNRKVLFTDALTQTETFNTVRDRKYTLSIVEAIAQTIALDVVVPFVFFDFSITEAESLVTALARQRGESFTVAETETIAIAAINRAREIIEAINETETITTDIVRGRNVVPAIDEVETVTPTIDRFRLVDETITEAEVVSETLDRNRNVDLTVTEQEVITAFLNRAFNVSFTVSEVETITAALGRIKYPSFSVNETETIVPTVIRALTLASTISENETITMDIIRARKLLATLTEQETITPSLVRDLTVTPTIDEQEAINAELARLLSASFANNETETVTPNIVRNRSESLSIIETSSYSFLLGKLKDVAFALVETFNYTANLNVARLKLLVTTITEASAYTFGAIRRTRNVISVINEVLDYVIAINRDLTTSFTVTEQEVMTSTLGVLREMHVALLETEIVSMSLSRRRGVETLIAEIDSVIVNLSRTLTYGVAVDESETITNKINRLRNATIAISEQESIDALLNRARFVIIGIDEVTTEEMSINRAREVLVSIGETEDLLFNFGKLINTGFGVSESESVVIHLTKSATLWTMYCVTSDWVYDETSDTFNLVTTTSEPFYHDVNSTTVCEMITSSTTVCEMITSSTTVIDLDNQDIIPVTINTSN